MTADVYLVCVSDAAKVKQIEKYLDEMKSMVYVNVKHVCPQPNASYLRQRHVKLIVYSDMYYEKLVAMVIGANATIAPEDVTEDFRLDTTAALIGYCVCQQQTQGDIATFEMS